MLNKILHLDATDTKLAIFSDTHLTRRFDSAQFEFLWQLIGSVDQVIINGDFWDKAGGAFEQFVNSPWKQLFPLLKAKRAVYLFGNHDRPEMSDDRVSLFSTYQAYECQVKLDNMMLKVTHGHQFAPSPDVLLPQIFNCRLLLQLGNWLALLRFKLSKGLMLHPFFSVDNWRIKRNTRTQVNGEVLVCGHSHSAEFNLKQKYINHGVVRWGYGQFLLIENNNLQLVKRRY